MEGKYNDGFSWVHSNSGEIRSKSVLFSKAFRTRTSRIGRERGGQDTPCIHRVEAERGSAYAPPGMDVRCRGDDALIRAWREGGIQEIFSLGPSENPALNTNACDGASPPAPAIQARKNARQMAGAYCSMGKLKKAGARLSRKSARTALASPGFPRDRARDRP